MDDLLTPDSVKKGLVESAEKNKDMSMSDIFSFDRFKKIGTMNYILGNKIKSIETPRYLELFTIGNSTTSAVCIYFLLYSFPFLKFYFC